MTWRDDLGVKTLREWGIAEHAVESYQRWLASEIERLREFHYRDDAALADAVLALLEQVDKP